MVIAGIVSRERAAGRPNRAASSVRRALSLSACRRYQEYAAPLDSPLFLGLLAIVGYYALSDPWSSVAYDGGGGRGCSRVLVFTASSRFTAHLVLASPRDRLAVVRRRRHRHLLRHDLPVIIGRPVPGRLCVPRRRDLWTCATGPTRRPRDRARRGACHDRREHVRADSLAGASRLPGWLADFRGGHLMRLSDSRPPAARAAPARIAQPLSAHARLSAFDAGDVADAHERFHLHRAACARLVLGDLMGERRVDRVVCAVRRFGTPSDNRSGAAARGITRPQLEAPRPARASASSRPRSPSRCRSPSRPILRSAISWPSER